jgi:hypothetical protein
MEDVANRVLLSFRTTETVGSGGARDIGVEEFYNIITEFWDTHEISQGN